MTGELDQNPPGRDLLQLWLEDYRAHGSSLLSPGFIAVAVHRFGNTRMRVKSRALRRPLSAGYKLAHTLVNWVWGIDLPYTVKLGRRVRIWHHGGIVISAKAIGDDCQIRQGCTLGVAHTGDPAEQVPELGCGVDLGVHSCVLGPVVVGDNVVVGAGAVVVQDLHGAQTVVGVPAKPVDARPIRVGSVRRARLGDRS